MPTSLGISVGASGAGSALRVDAAHAPTTEFRRLASESQPGRDLGDLVFDAVSLTSPRGTARGADSPAIITVAYRTEEQAHEIRTAAERTGHMVRLVPETTAALEYLYTVGVRRDPGAIALVDIGATGTTVSVLDRETGTLLRSARTETVGGDALTARVLDHVRNATERMRTRRQIDPGLLAARCQGAQEALSSATTTRIDIAEAGPDATVTLTRAQLDELTTDLADEAAAFTRRICSSTDPVPETMALIGGAAASPVLAAAISAEFDGEIVTVPEPGAAAAIGAALSADSPSSVGYTVVGSLSRTGNRSSGRVSGAVAGLLVLSAIMAGFATQHFTERDSSDAQVSPRFTSGDVPTQEAGPGESAVPSHDPPPEPVTSRSTRDAPAPTTVPWPLPTVEHTVPSTQGPWPTVPESSSTTVTPTPIDQVPTPGSTAEEESDPDRPFTSPDSETAPRPDPDSTAPDSTAPDTTAPDTTAPDTTEPTTPPETTSPAPTDPETTEPSTGVSPTPPPTTSPTETPSASSTGAYPTDVSSTIASVTEEGTTVPSTGQTTTGETTTGETTTGSGTSEIALT
ncbi:Hsp70 family protein [Rhodococcus pyridinivorans]|uniref:Hsp70 family protein n=1 Tax=Rhodococcus pyridinivorans TaxID=103816 RepID=UPI001E483C9E|nr:Hsp70 family protein [Rhodococcus pyridinivorans]UGQ59505.1 Hsp70 family protein [Rhodococcus pyridinivorans]